MKTDKIAPQVSTIRRWTATVVLSLLLMAAGVLLEMGRPLERLLEERTVPMSHAMVAVQNYVTAVILQIHDVPYDTDGAKILVRGLAANAPAIPTADPWHGEAVTLLLMLLCGVPAVWRTWNLARWQKLAILGVTVVLAPLMLAVTAGLAMSVSMTDWSRHGGDNIKASEVMALESATFATCMITVGLWILIKKLLAEEPPEAPAPRQPWMIHRPPVLWASLLLCAATMIVCIVNLPKILAWQGGAETSRRIASILGVLGALGVLIQFIRTGRRSLANWAMLSLVLCLSGGLGNYVPGMLLMLIALTFFDERTAALCGAPIDAAAAQRLDARQKKPLLAVTIMLAALAGLAGIYQVRLYFTDTAVTYIPILASSLVSLVPAMLASFLGWWESRSLQRDFPVLAYAPFAASALGAMCFVLGLAALFASWGHQPLLGIPRDNPSPWPPTVRVDDQYHLESFPNVVGPYLVPMGRGGHNGEGILDAGAQAAFGIPADFSTVRLSERIGNWYLMNVYLDKRPESRVHLLSLGILYYGGLPATATQRIEPPIGNFQTPVSNIVFTTNQKDQAWRVVPALREAEPANPEGDIVHINYYVYDLNGLPCATIWHVRQLARNFSRPFDYLAVFHVGLAIKKENYPYADLAAQQFFATMLPTMLDLMPKGK